MKKYCLILLVISSFLKISAQEWAPIGAKWTYDLREAFGPFVRNYIELQCIGDTVILGKACRNIVGIDGMISYEDSNRVYRFNPETNRFTLLYDFNKGPGESWFTETATCRLKITVVDTNDIIIINGNYFKVLRISSEDYAFNGRITKYIGHLGMPLPDPWLYCFNTYVDGTYYSGLRCYEDTIIGLYETGLAPYCNYKTDIEEKYLKNHLTLYPSPASQNLTLNVSDEHAVSTIHITNLQGKTLKTYRGFQENIPVADLSNGLYFLHVLFTNSETVVKKIMKQ